MDGKDLSTQDKIVGIFRVAFYPGNGNTFSVVRAWRVGEFPSVIRNEPYPSWQLFEGSYEEALALYKSLETEWDVERQNNPMTRNPRITRAEEITEFRENYPEEMSKKKKKK
jgi:hypothetical protein